MSTFSRRLILASTSLLLRPDGTVFRTATNATGLSRLLTAVEGGLR